MRYKILLILAVLLFSLTLNADDKTIIQTYNDVQNKLKDSNPFDETIRKVYDAMLNSKGKVVDVFPTNDAVISESKKIIKKFDLPDIKEMVDDETCIDPEVLGDFRIYIFISKSVPEKTLKNYMRDALKLKDTLLVMRGVIGSADFLKPTQDFIVELSCGKKQSEMTAEDKCNVSRVDINPLLFTLFKIDKVPAIVFSKLSYHELMLRSNTGKKVNDDEYFIIKGDMSLRYALTKFKEVGADTERFITVLNGKYGG